MKEIAAVSLSMGKLASLIVIAILVSSAISIGTSTILITGSQGPEGPQGEQGPQGEPGLGVESDFIVAPAYDSGWVTMSSTGEWMVFDHGLGTADVLIQVYRNGPADYGINQYKYGEYMDWILLNEQNVTVRIGLVPGYSEYDQVRVMMWKISQP